MLDRRQVDDAVGDHQVEPAVLEGQLGDRGLDEFDSLEAVALAEPLRLGELLVGEVDADDTPLLADHDRGAEGVGPRAAAEVENGLAGPQLCEIEVIPDARERRDRLRRYAIERRRRISESLGERAPDFEVKLESSSRATWRYMSLTASSSRSESTRSLASACGRPSAARISSAAELV